MNGYPYEYIRDRYGSIEKALSVSLTSNGLGFYKGYWNGFYWFSLA